MSKQMEHLFIGLDIWRVDSYLVGLTFEGAFLFFQAQIAECLLFIGI